MAWTRRRKRSWLVRRACSASSFNGGAPRFAHLALDGGNQPRQVLLGDIIVGAGAHGVDGRLFADRAGHDDEGNVAVPFALAPSERQER